MRGRLIGSLVAVLLVVACVWLFRIPPAFGFTLGAVVTFAGYKIGSSADRHRRLMRG